MSNLLRHQARSIDELVWACREETDMDRKVALYQQIRKALSYPPELAAPAMMTDDFIDSALDNI
ncbi:hypothetical protein [Nitrososphaera sp.]|uniref:hypothetical protein n=1 Tax=Nitrososphaera sp. TaxID=1971748 RepID=UPI00307F85B5